LVGKGFPTTKHQIDKAVARGELKPDAWWGPISLFTTKTADRYAEAKLRRPDPTGSISSVA
jgi:hypothetical protein